MALFSRTSKKKEAPAATAAAASPARAPLAPATLAHVLLSPRITEKATYAAGMNVYVFDVARSANKKQIEEAVKAAYDVKPRMVRVVNIRPKTVRNMRTGKTGMKSGGKKAYVYLAKGETITIA